MIVNYEWGDFFSLGSGIHPVVVAALWIPVGATLGIFTEFFMRTVGEIKYEELKFINPGRWNIQFNALLISLSPLTYSRSFLELE